VQSILLNGFWPRYSLEDAVWYRRRGESFCMAVPMVCFCDIPLSRISEHVDFYGKFGIGVRKDWAIKTGLNPILYVSTESPLCSHINNIYEKFHSLDDGQDGFFELLGLDLTKLMSFVKPLRGEARAKGVVHTKDFFQENEWRYVPSTRKIMHWLSREVYLDAVQIERENLLTKEHCSLAVSPADISYIFVESQGDVPKLIDFVEAADLSCTPSEKKRLLTRINCLEDIENDM